MKEARSRRRRVADFSPIARTRRDVLRWLGPAGLVAIFAGCDRRVRRPIAAGPVSPGLPAGVPTSSTAAPASPGSTGETDALRRPAPAPQRTLKASPSALPRRPPVATPRPLPRRPNVLLITIDTLRADRIGASGFAGAHTPTIDRLAAEGVRFSHASCQRPQTNSSHATLFTGLYASTNRVRWHMVDKLRPGSQTLAGIFAANGYRTAGIYSWVSLDPQFCGLDQGFQTYQGYVVNRTGIFANQRLEELAAVYRHLEGDVPVMRTVDGALGASDHYEQVMDGRADVTTAAALARLDGYTAAHPFFLWLHYYDPHYPYTPPPPYDHVLGLSYRGQVDGSIQTIHHLLHDGLQPTAPDVARLYELYQGEIAYADSQLGRVIDGLRRRGLLDEMVVAVVGDHGESFGEHGDWTHGERLWENEVHVPLILRYPSRLPAGLVVQAPAQLIDVMPTLLDLVGLRALEPVQGASLLPLAEGRDDGRERYAFVELADRGLVSVATSDWALIKNIGNGERQLYHLWGDSDERNNLADHEATLVRQLDARLEALMKFAGVTR